MHVAVVTVRHNEVQMLDNRKSLDNSESDIFLFTEPATEVLPWLEIRDLGRLGLTCTFFQMQLPIARAAYYVAVQTSVVEIQKILDAASPELLRKLLTKKIAKVATKSSRTLINHTLLQLSFGEGDDDMCYVFKPYFERAFGSVGAAREEIRRQINEKCPEESEEEKQQREAEDLRIKNHLAGLLAAVIQAITNEQFNHGLDAEDKWILTPATLAAIATFREALDALQAKIVDKGMHYRSNTLQETYDAYFQAARQWQDDFKRCALFEDGVLSSVLSYVPENDAERFSQGLYYLQNDPPEPFTRRKTLRDTNMNFYDHLRQASEDFSGLTGSGVDIFHGREQVGVETDSYLILCQTKAANLQSFRSQSENIPRHGH